MQLPLYSVNEKPTQPLRGLNIIQQFPDVSADLRIKNVAIKTIILKNFQFLDISRNKKAEELRKQNIIWPVSRKISPIAYGKTFQRISAFHQADRYLKVLLIILGLGLAVYLGFSFL